MNKSSEKRTKTSLSVRPSLWKAADIAGTELDKHISDVVEEALESWLDLQGKLPPDPHAEILAKVRKALDGNADDARTMREAILGAAAYIVSREKLKA